MVFLVFMLTDIVQALIILWGSHPSLIMLFNYNAFIAKNIMPLYFEAIAPVCASKLDNTCYNLMNLRVNSLKIIYLSKFEALTPTNPRLWLYPRQISSSPTWGGVFITPRFDHFLLPAEGGR